ncbi:hypothetical protein KSF_062580 [Reticulibacter mediterranei]|uniref:DUF2703 domain-containing protein n=1 Tax=Reticulibacter mediterranei TaxID=2778369 RepID=A0A8J3ISP9_9CHLR|nr:DUF2703 domain-containing protein [Reticulibacter mediterranei]GHO96210.1 hypothetical protein KSF_062580 [Reticulibacter mediterranei]
MPTIEFFYWEECPSHERALAILREVMAEEGITAPVDVIEVKTEDEAQRYHFYGSPTIHINGRDIVLPLEDAGEPSLTCRAYRRADGRISPQPPRERIIAALRAASHS